jgi:hypothetical protein
VARVLDGRNGKQFTAGEGSMSKLNAGEVAVKATEERSRSSAAPATCASTPSSSGTATRRSTRSSKAPRDPALVIEVGAGNVPGAQIATQTATFKIPYRPSANTKKCSLTAEGVVGWGKECYSGKTHRIVFHLTGVTLPAKAILSIAYDTSDYGYAPTHGPDIGQNSMNVAVREPAESGPSVGGDPLPSGAYLNSLWSGAYCNGALGTGTFRLDEGCWTGYQPAISVKAVKG